MSADLAMLYGWVFFAMLGGLCGFVIGWSMCERAAIAAAIGAKP